MANWELSVNGESPYKIDPLYGKRGIFDLQPYLNQGIFPELRDVQYFNQVGIVFGAVTWPNEQDIAPDTLMAGLVSVEEESIFFSQYNLCSLFIQSDRRNDR